MSVSESRPGVGDRPVLQLVAASFVTLATELVLIRWLPGQVRVIAYFPNLILIAAFLGLGTGCLLQRKLPLWTWPASLIVLTGTSVVMSGIAFTQESRETEYLWLLYWNLPRNAPVVHGIRLPILLIFVLTGVTFVPLGGFVAQQLNAFKKAGQPLAGYAADLAGSLIGVVVLSLVLVSGAKPLVWMTVILVPGAILFWKSPRLVAVYAAMALALLAILARAETADWYSPYYAISVVSEPFGSFRVLTNGSFHQNALPLSDRRPAPTDGIAMIRAGYHVPYRLLGRKPRNILILGAGTGNDVAVAIDENPVHIDAVEIDPLILRLGDRHPDAPYRSPIVTRINTDAREFLNYSDKKYDLIIFGTLDSMTRLSALSNIRLDNYVYTVECLQEARRHLTSDGGVVMLFSVGTEYIERHIAGILVRAFDEQPAVIRSPSVLFNRIFLAGPAFRPLASNAQIEKIRQAAALEAVPTDDWPFLYLRERTLSPFYLSIMGAILLVAIITVFGISREMRESITARRPDVVMFLFGMSFLLIETKLVTEMNLVWGATWLTSSVVFASILLTILIGTLWTARRQAPWALSAGALVLALLITWATPVRLFVGASLAVRLVASLLFIGLPMLFASVCFATVFGGRDRVDVAFGWNMLGAVAGGLAEFTSMIFGIKAMTLLATVGYLIAFLIINRASKETPAASAPFDNAAKAAVP
jgi:spermidine synthase